MPPQDLPPLLVPAARRGAALALRWVALLAAAIAIVSAPERAAAQAIDRPADERLPLPDLEQPPAPEPILPELPPPPPARERWSVGPGVRVVGYRFEGSSVFSEEELARVAEPWTGREILSEDLTEVRNAITRLYVDAGYVNSGAVVPDQDIAGGIVAIRIVEGSLGEIRIEGNTQLRSRYLRDRIARGAATPLNVRDLERRLQILQQDPRIERVAARLAPSESLGEAVLFVRIEEAPRFQVDLHYGNYEPASIGGYAGQVETLLASPTGWGDVLRGEFTIGEGVKRYRGRYEIPVTRWDTTVMLDARYADAEVTEAPFDALDIGSQFWSYSVGVSQPVYTSPRSNVELGVIGDWRRTRTELLGTPFSFPGSGSENGESTAAVLRFFAEWVLRDQRQVFAARSQVSWGVDALGATRHGGDEPDGSFVAWLLQLQWARRFGELGVEAVLRSDLQLANAPLLTMEQIAVGGYGTVRGYRQNQFVQDQGFVASAELRVPVWRWPELGGVIQIAPFVDVGRTWDHADRLGDRHQDLASAGVGLRWVLSRYLNARIYWGQNLTNVDTHGDLQDHGVQFLVSGSIP